MNKVRPVLLVGIMGSRLSSLAIISSGLACAIIGLDLRLWEHRHRVIEHDVHGYYAFLPALFIYDDIRLEKSDYHQGDDYYYFWPNITPDGRSIVKYPVGLAILYAPFFFIADALAPVLGHPATGFSAPYKVLLLICALVYLLLGLLLTRSFLLRLGYSDHAIALCLLLIGLGTNLLAYSSQSGTMPHVHGFFLFAAFIGLVIRWYERTNWTNTILLGILLGLITLVRPSNGVIFIFFLLYGIRSLSALRQRPALLWDNKARLVVMFLLALAVWTPQFLYWHVVTGEFIYYSYQDERFFFGHPNLLNGLFSFRKGWLIYTPVMIFALVGIAFMQGPNKKHRPAIITFVSVHLIITFSWWCWWYGGTFGQRSMIETYALLAIPLCAFCERVLLSRPLIRTSFYIVALFFIWLNIFQTYQFEEGSLHHDAMTRQLYFEQFGKLEKIDRFYELLDHPDYEKARRSGR